MAKFEKSETDKIITLPNDVFFEQLIELMAEGKTVTFVVKGYSMYPFMRNEKDSVCMKKYQGDGLKKGDVVLFRYRDRYILHRIIDIVPPLVGSAADLGMTYITKGDGNIRGKEFATEDTVCGIMLSRITPSGKVWNCSSFSWKFCSRLWHLLNPLRRYLLYILRRIYK